jgi:hypothetical protein
VDAGARFARARPQLYSRGGFLPGGATAGGALGRIEGGLPFRTARVDSRQSPAADALRGCHAERGKGHAEGRGEDPKHHSTFNFQLSP